ncbi:MAG: Thioredoxin protein [Flaviaesturariibacter sp.]|nr:Thioredoxin protein [Flaviaesturariibacter sp.]
MRNRNLALLLLLLAFMFERVSAQSGTILLSVTQVAQKLHEQPALVLDLRSAQEFEMGHIPGARRIDWKTKGMAALAGLDTTLPVLVYDETDQTTAEAADALRNSGFSRVILLQGGFAQWRLARLPLEVPVPAKLVNLTSQQFGALLRTDKTVIIDVYADWCGPCKAMKPHLEKVEKELAGQLTVIRINADDNPELMNGLNITALPTLLIFKNQKLQQASVGYLNKAGILKLVR